MILAALELYARSYFLTREEANRVCQEEPEVAREILMLWRTELSNPLDVADSVDWGGLELDSQPQEPSKPLEDKPEGDR